MITENNLRVAGSLFSGAFGSFIDQEFLEKYVSGKATYLPYRGTSMDLKSISPYCFSTISNYRLEHDAEMYREIHHPFFPSRLSAIFAFGDFKTCQEVADKHGWDIRTVKRFSLTDNPLNRVVKVNMEHVSLARDAYIKGSLMEAEINRLWRGYWTGFGNIKMDLPLSLTSRKSYESGVIWEYLIEGVVKLI